MAEPPIGIIICHPKAFFKQYDEKKWLLKMAELNTVEGSVWHRVMKNLPTKDFLYIYTAYDGKMQHRTNLVEIFRNRDMKFPRPEGGVRTFLNASGLVLGPPFVRALREIPCKGFQGFHYVTETYVNENLW